jgi:hypothetical protein
MASERVTAANPPLVRRSKSGGSLAIGVVDEAGGDVDDMAAPLLDHVWDDALSDVEEPHHVHIGDGHEVVERVIRKRFADEDAGIVDQGVDVRSDRTRARLPCASSQPR